MFHCCAKITHIFFFAYFWFHSCNALNLHVPAKSLVIREIETFFGQYSCLPDDVGGVRSMLSFDIILENDGDGVVTRRDGVDINYVLKDVANSSLYTGTLHLDCLRDKQCTDAVKYYTCSPPRLSAGCNYTLAREAACNWIDITNVTVGDYILQLNLENISLVELEFLPSKVPRLGKNRLELFLVATAFLLISMSFATFEPLYRYEKLKRK